MICFGMFKLLRLNFTRYRIHQIVYNIQLLPTTDKIKYDVRKL